MASGSSPQVSCNSGKYAAFSLRLAPWDRVAKSAIWASSLRAAGDKEHRVDSKAATADCFARSGTKPQTRAKRSMDAGLASAGCNGQSLMKANVFEFDGLAVNAASRRSDPVGKLARFENAPHQGFDIPVILFRRKPLIAAPVPLRLADDLAFRSDELSG